MTTQLNSKLLTLNCNRKQKRTLRQKGFTLIELMVVTAIAGVLGAVAVPKFLQAREAAESKAAIAEVVGAARECQNYLSAGGSESGMTQPSTKLSGVNDPIDCEDGAIYALTLSNGTFAAKTDTAPGVKCLGKENEVASAITVKATSNISSGLDCSFSAT